MGIVDNLITKLVVAGSWTLLDNPVILRNVDTSNDLPAVIVKDAPEHQTVESNDGELNIIEADVPIKIIANSETDVNSYEAKLKVLLKSHESTSRVCFFKQSINVYDDNNMSYVKEIIYTISEVV